VTQAETGQKPRVLVIAEAANPDWVSVPLIGWSMARALREVADVHLVTQIRNREAILNAGWEEGRDFTAIDSEAFAKPLWAIGKVLRGGEGKGWTALQLINALSYPYFEHLIWKAFGPDIRAGRYDIVHRVTPLSPTISSPLARKCKKAGVPFVVGPLNGGVPWPTGFDSERRREKEWLSYVRGVYKAMPGRTRSLESASAIIGGSGHTLSEIPARFADKCVYIPENAIDPDRFSDRADHVPGVTRACFIGRMVPYKGPDMLIEAARPLLAAGKMTLDMVGDGPMLEALKEQAADLGDAVRFHGWVAHDEVQNILKTSTLFTFPSIREFGGGVVLEAMALGVPSLIVDYAGPGELVQEGLGFKVPLGTREEIIAQFAEQLTELTDQPDLLRETGARAYDHVQNHLTWARKAEQVFEIYQWVLGQGDKPAPFAGVKL
jgi:glycosyltransferase involved in cell wall biosynthesis